MVYSHLETEIETQAFTAALARLYGLEKSEEAQKRCKEVINGFRETFRNDAETHISLEDVVIPHIPAPHSA